MIKLKDGYAKLIGTSYLGSADNVLLSNGGDIGKAVASTASTLVQRNTSGLIESTITDKAPFVVSSNKVVTNLNADYLDNFSSSDFKHVNVNKISYTPNLAHHGWGSMKSSHYYKISISSVNGIWTMLYLEAALKEKHSEALYGKLLIHVLKSNANNISGFCCFKIGNLSSSILVYACNGSTFDIYIAGNWSYPTLDISKVTFGDSACDYTKNITLSVVTELPTSYSTAAVFSNITSFDYTSYLPLLNSSTTHATNTSVIYAPSTAGTKGLVLTSNGSGAPVWSSITSLKNPYSIKFKKPDDTTVSYDGSSELDLTEGIRYAIKSSVLSTLNGSGEATGLPYYTYTTLNSEFGTTGTATTTYLKNYIKKLVKSHSGISNYIGIGALNPNSIHIGLFRAYSMSNYNNTGMPEHSSGFSIPLDGRPEIWGTAYGNWYHRLLAYTTDIPTVTDYYWANIKISTSSSITTSPTFGGVTVNGNLTLNVPNADSIKIKRTASGAGSFIDYMAANQTTEFWRVGSSSNHHFMFEYKGGGNVLMLIKSDGNVGIGTDNPSKRLTVSGGSILQLHQNTWLNPANLMFGRSDATIYTDRAVVGVTNGNLHLDSYSGYAIYFNHYVGTAAGLTKGMVLTSSGYLGIGEAPNEKLHVAGNAIATNFGISSSAGDGAGISLYSGIGHVGSYGIAMVKTATSGWGTHGQVSGDWATYFNMSKNGSNKRGWIFRSDSTNVASIGTGGEITAGLFIANNTSGPHFTGTSASGNWAYMRLHNSTCYWDIATNNSSSHGTGGLWLSRYNGSSTGIFVSTGGNVGISTSSPSQKLHVNGDIFLNNYLYFTDSAAARIKYGTHTTTALGSYPLPSLGSNGLGLYVRPSKSTDEGGIIITEDTCMIFNSADSGWSLQVHNTDLSQKDFSGTNGDGTKSRVFGIIDSGSYVWSRGGFLKDGSSDSYVLLGGGGHKTISSLSVASATKLTTARTIWGQSFDGTGNVDGVFTQNISHTTGYSNNAFFGASSATTDAIINITFGKAKSKCNLGYIGHVHKGDGLDTNYVTIGGFAKDQLLNVLYNGNVGVGTTSPEYKLDVNGNTTVRGIFRIFPGDATLAIYADTSANSNYGTEGISIQTTFDGQDPVTSSYPSTYPTRGVLQLQPRGGNIAIGLTTANSYKLEINGSVYSNNWIRSSTGFYIENRGVHYTFNPASNGVGEYHSSLNNEFNISTSYANRDFYFNYRAPAYGSAVTHYLWNAGSPTSWATHTTGSINSYGGFLSYLHNSFSYDSWYNFLEPSYAVFWKPNLLVEARLVLPILAWANLINNLGYITRYSISSYRENYSFGTMRISVGNNDAGTSGGCYLDLDARGVISTGSNMYAAHFYENSDQLLKLNIQNILSSDNIPLLRLFDWKESGSHGYGLIAQELEDLGYGELVSIRTDGFKSVNYSAALSLIVGKLQVKIKELEEEIENLKNKN